MIRTTKQIRNELSRKFIMCTSCNEIVRDVDRRKISDKLKNKLLDKGLIHTGMCQMCCEDNYSDSP